MSEETLKKIFAKCALYWDIPVEKVQNEYASGLFKIEQLDKATYYVVHVSRPDFIIILDEEE